LDRVVDGRDGMPDRNAARHHAGPPRNTAQVYGAGAAQRDTASELGPTHAEQVPQDAKQGHLGFGFDLVRLAVDLQSDQGALS